MAFVGRAYGIALQRAPVVTSSATAGFLYGTGDYVAQRLEKAYNVESHGKKGYNYERTARMVIFGCVVAGPCLRIWYSVLDRMTSVFCYRFVAMDTSAASASWLSTIGKMYRKEPVEKLTAKRRGTFAKIILDQLFFQAPFLNFYFGAMGLLEGKSIVDSWDVCRQNFHDAWVYAMIFWSPAQFVNFWWVPLHHQVLYVSAVSVVWQTFLSLLFHTRDYGEKAAQHAVEESHLAHAASEHRLSSAAEAEEEAAEEEWPGALEQLSIWTGRLFEAAANRAEATGNVSLALGERVIFAGKAARVAWMHAWDIDGRQESSDCGGALASARTVALCQEDNPRPAVLREQVESQAKLIDEQQRQIEVMQRTIAGQAMRIQLLQERDGSSE
eukprot:TRINITY_DN9869_c0_g1_i1.p1 TRINITY_DN9869_c0_g1~~TRINITY_DN9869_c0_g1_i1.p1  ORF type:complete len:385 (+),score=76.86 TRINITY_DN9869_c0_g1_i1:67-1221(+)